jgi:chitin synthase
MSGQPNFQQYGPPQGEQQRRPSGFDGPPQSYIGPPQGGQRNPVQSMILPSNSALTFNGSSQSLLNRKPTIRHIPLTPEGNLVVDVPVPDRVLANAKYQSGDEFTYTRYTAVTSTADQFPYSGYTLRQQEMQRSTEIFIVVTMYLFEIIF